MSARATAPGKLAMSATSASQKGAVVAMLEEEVTSLAAPEDFATGDAAVQARRGDPPPNQWFLVSSSWLTKNYFDDKPVTFVIESSKKSTNQKHFAVRMSNEFTRAAAQLEFAGCFVSELEVGECEAFDHLEFGPNFTYTDA